MGGRSFIPVLILSCLVLLLGCTSFVESKKCPKSSTVHKKTFRSPAFSLEPGDVQDRYYTMEFPKGHLGIKNFFGEVVDDQGNSVPLSEVYLHHWVVLQLYIKSSEKVKFLRKGYHGHSNPSFQLHVKDSEKDKFLQNGAHGGRSNGTIIVAGNDGICQHDSLPQYWGLGSETRHTNYSVPNPYAINVGDPKKIPEGYEELWDLNVHAIDTRGTEDPQGCLECRCNLYNVTKDRSGNPIREGYKGGLRCCYEGTRCKVKEGYEAERRTLYLQYTVEWVEWDECVLPVRSYIFDATDTGERDPFNSKVGCKVEYNIPLCDVSNGLAKDCTHVLETSLAIPKGGNVIYGVAHQHAGAKRIVMHGEDGREICSSVAMYGNGTAPGDEAGYIVGMSTCYPELGSVKVESNERLRLTSYYSSLQEHTGVMALFYLLVADEPSQAHEGLKVGKSAFLLNNALVVAGVLAMLAFVGLAAACSLRKKPNLPEYEALAS